MEQKKEWKTPELIVLVRNQPEEAVLACCKVGFFAGPVATPFGCISGTSPCLGLVGS
jgi:hypothetical protein